MFPPELCRVLAELHDHAPVHAWRESKRDIERAFGKPVEDLFESIDHEPLASGSVAQVQPHLTLNHKHTQGSRSSLSNSALTGKGLHRRWSEGEGSLLF